MAYGSLWEDGDAAVVLGRPAGPDETPIDATEPLRDAALDGDSYVSGSWLSDMVLNWRMMEASEMSFERVSGLKVGARLRDVRLFLARPRNGASEPAANRDWFAFEASLEWSAVPFMRLGAGLVPALRSEWPVSVVFHLEPEAG